jgi:hypothetical protein
MKKKIGVLLIRGAGRAGSKYRKSLLQELTGI